MFYTCHEVQSTKMFHRQLYTNRNHAYVYVSIESVIHHTLALDIEILLVKSSNYSNISFDKTDLLRKRKVRDIAKETFEEIYQKIYPCIVFIVS